MLELTDRVRIPKILANLLNSFPNASFLQAAEVVVRLSYLEKRFLSIDIAKAV